MQRRSPLHLVAALAVATCVFLVHCDDAASSQGEGGAGGGPVLPEIIYDGKASDEALSRLWDRIPGAEADPAKAATLTLPADGSAVPASPPSDLAWELAIARASPATPRGDPALRGFPRLAFGPAVASAHLPPVTGWVYLVELTPTGGGVIRLLTTNTRWTPDPGSWGAIVGAGGASVRIWNAYLNANVVEEGPYVMPTAASFTVAP